MSDARADPRAVLDDLADRRRRCTAAIVTLAAFYQLDARGWLDDAIAATDTKPVSAVDLTTVRPRGSTPPTRKMNGAKRATRPTTAPTETQERILTALKAAGEPVSPGELAKAMRMEPVNVRYHLKALVKSGLVHAQGATANRRLSIAS